MGTYIRTRTEKVFNNPESITGFREVKTQRFTDPNTDLSFDFELEKIEINVKTNQMVIYTIKNFYDKHDKIFKSERYSYMDFDQMGEYEIEEVVDSDTDEVIEVLNVVKLSDDYTPVSNWDNQLGELISSAIIQQIIKRNNLND